MSPTRSPLFSLAHPVSRGFTLIEVLVAVAMMSIVGAGFASMMTAMQRENRSVGDKIEALDLERQFGTLMSDAPLCACQFSTAGPLQPTTPATTPASWRVELNKLITSCADPSRTFAVVGERMRTLSPSFVVTKVAAAELVPTGHVEPGTTTFDEYLGVFTIEFDPAASSGGARPLRALRTTTMFRVTGNRITGCAAANGYFDGPSQTNTAGMSSPLPSFAACPPGHAVISGGWVTDGTPPTCANSFIIENRAANNGLQQGWIVNATCLTFRAKALCQRGQ